MTIQRRWNLLACTVVLSGVVLGGVLVSGRLRDAAPRRIMR